MRPKVRSQRPATAENRLLCQSDHEPAFRQIERGAGRLGVATAPLSNWIIRQGWFRWILERVVGLDRRRSLPPYARRSFADWFAGRAAMETTPTKKVVLFDDTFMSYHEPGVGVAATRLLEAAGYEVILGKRNCCGRSRV